MKVLMTSDNLGGVLTYAVDLAKGMKTFGIEIVLAIMGNPLTKNQTETLKDLKYHFFECKQEWMENPWKDIRIAGKWLMHLKKVETPDLVHLNAYSFGKLPWNIPIVMTIHSCVLSWWESVKKEKAPDEWLSYKRNVTEGIEAADIIIAPSNYMLQEARKYYNIPNQAKVVYNGRDHEFFYKDIKEKYIFSMGRLWDEAKNVKAIINAAPKIDYPIFIAGENHLFRLLHLPDNVYMLNHLTHNEVSEWLANASVYFLPVLYEPFGYTFLEAALSGCAIVAGDIAPMHEIWDSCISYVDPENIDQMSEKINNLMRDDESLKNLATRSYNRAIERYTLEKMLNEYLNIYDEACKLTKHVTVSTENLRITAN